MKNISIKILLSLVLLTIIKISAIGQGDLIKPAGEKYFYQGHFYALRDLGPVIGQVPEAVYYFSEGKERYHLSTALGILVGVSLGTGLFAFTAIKPSDGSLLQAIIIPTYNETLRVTGKILTASGLAFMVAALSTRTEGTKLMQKSIDIFNGVQGNTSGSSLSIQLKGSGVGLVLQF